MHLTISQLCCAVGSGLIAPLPTLAAEVSYGTYRSACWTNRVTQHLTHLQRLEAESIHIMREVMAEAKTRSCCIRSAKIHR